jgi:hypothetical protein
MATSAPSSMKDPKLATGKWAQKCPVEGCKTETQGGDAGLGAHLRVVHDANLRSFRQ